LPGAWAVNSLAFSMASSRASPPPHSTEFFQKERD
jgi:hypothetical protein